MENLKLWQTGEGIFAARETSSPPRKDIDFTLLYENILTIQNAADLEHPAIDPANTGVRAQFLLGIFPPDHGGNHTQPTPPAPQTLGK